MACDDLPMSPATPPPSPARTLSCWYTANDSGVPFAHDSGFVRALALDPVGRYLCSAHSSGVVCVWSTRDARVLWRFTAHRGSATCLLHHAGLLWTGGSDKLLRGWDLTARKQPVKELRGHFSGVKQLYAGCGEHGAHTLWSLGDDRYLRLWRVSDKTQLAFVSADFAAPAAVVSSELCCIAQSSSVAVFSAPSCKRLFDLDGHAGVVWTLMLCGRVLFSGADDGAVREWLLDDTVHELVHTYRGHKRAVTLLSMAGVTLLAASLDGVRGWRKRQCAYIITCDASSGGAPRALVASCDGASFVLGSASGTISQYSTADGGLLNQFGGMGNAVHVFAVCDDRGLGFASSYDGDVKGWRVSTPRRWSRDTHVLFEPAFQAAVRTFLCCIAQPDSPTHMLMQVGGASQDGLVDMIVGRLAMAWHA
jgi:WD40 repeat protein